MKFNQIFSLLALGTVLFFTSCKENQSEYDKKIAAMKVGDKMVITRDVVPVHTFLYPYHFPYPFLLQYSRESFQQLIC